MCKNYFPEKVTKQIGELVPDFFNSLSLEYSPLTDEDTPSLSEIKYTTLEPYQVSGRLKAMRKPNSQVNRNIAPRLVTIYHALLALPLTHIYNEVLK